MPHTQPAAPLWQRTSRHQIAAPAWETAVAGITSVAGIDGTVIVAVQTTARLAERVCSRSSDIHKGMLLFEFPVVKLGALQKAYISV